MPWKLKGPSRRTARRTAVSSAANEMIRGNWWGPAPSSRRPGDQPGLNWMPLRDRALTEAIWVPLVRRAQVSRRFFHHAPRPLNRAFFPPRRFEFRFQSLKKRQVCLTVLCQAERDVGQCGFEAWYQNGHLHAQGIWVQGVSGAYCGARFASWRSIQAFARATSVCQIIQRLVVGDHCTRNRRLNSSLRS